MGWPSLRYATQRDEPHQTALRPRTRRVPSPWRRGEADGALAAGGLAARQLAGPAAGGPDRRVGRDPGAGAAGGAGAERVLDDRIGQRELVRVRGVTRGVPRRRSGEGYSTMTVPLIAAPWIEQMYGYVPGTDGM